MPRVLQSFLLLSALVFGLGSASAQTPNSSQQPAVPPPAATPVPPPAAVPEQPAPPAVQPVPALHDQQVAPAPASAAAAPDQPAPAVAPPPASELPTAADQPAADTDNGNGEMSADELPSAKPAKKSAERPEKADNDKPLPASEVHNPILWHEPGNIAAKNLYYGVGGQKNMPRPPFTFIAEDKSGTNPKFDARDANGKKWRVKLGEEARPEVAASRLLWAVGYYANDDYNLPDASVEGLKLSRGKVKGEHIEFARFERKPAGKQKIAIWKWKENPFLGTRDFDGLRVMMAVMNNWDLKDVNNSVYSDDKTGKQYFIVNDVGATFATNALQLHRSQDKGNVRSFEKSKFITKTTDKTVDFATPAAPTGVLIKSLGIMSSDYFRRSGFQWIGQDIPREHARWIGKLLGQLSTQQIRDAFRAGNFPPEEIDMYVTIVHNRILLLQEL